MAKKTKKSSKPTGLTITRQGKHFFFEWSSSGNNESQTLKYNVGDGLKKRENLGKNTCRVSEAVNTDNYYPNKSKYLKKVEFQVTRTEKDTDKINYTVSDPAIQTWEPHDLDHSKVPKPRHTVTVIGENTCKFEFDVDVDPNSTTYWISGIQWSTCRTKNKDINKPEKIKSSEWGENHVKHLGSGNTSIHYEKEQTEGNIDFGEDGVHVTRWFRYRTIGPCGVGKWNYCWHTYGRPNEPVMQETSRAGGYGSSITKLDDGLTYRVNTTWKMKNSTITNPVDHMEIDYCVAKPDGVFNFSPVAQEYNDVEDMPSMEEEEETSGNSLNHLLPDEPSWSTAIDNYKDTIKLDSYSFDIDSKINENYCAWVRIRAINDELDSKGSATFLLPTNFEYKLSKPSGFNVTVGETNKVSVNVSDSTGINGAFIVVVAKSLDGSDESAMPIGVITQSDSMPAVFDVPEDLFEEGCAYGVYSAVGTYSIYPTGTGTNGYIINLAQNLKSDIEWSGGRVPGPPEIQSVEYIDEKDDPAILVKWAPNSIATETEITWAEKKRAWYSDQTPSSKSVSVLMNPMLYIESVEKGLTYYIRARSINYENDNALYSGYVDADPITLASKPTIPMLTLSKNGVDIDDNFVASWQYTNDDGSTQKTAKIVEVDYDPDDATINGYGTTLYEKTSTAQSVNFTVKELQENYGWEIGKTYYMAVMVTSSFDKSSDYSSPVSVELLEPLVCTITSSSLIYERDDTEVLPEDYGSPFTFYNSDGTSFTVTQDDVLRANAYNSNGDVLEVGSVYLALKELPLTVNINGAGTGDQVQVSIIRVNDYDILRPDNSYTGGYEDEVIASVFRFGSGEVQLTLDDIYPGVFFDDNVYYRLKAVITDDYGRTSDGNPESKDELEFKVNWTDQAIELSPEDVEVEIDYDSYDTTVAMITVSPPTGTRETDTIDIYRLSADNPVLVVEGGSFDTTYVDPYPTIGEKGGYRIVFMTANKDYIAPGNKIAWIDIDYDFAYEYELINQIFFRTIENIVSFGHMNVSVPYNISLSNNWKKDFRETKYLGGDTRGDWTAGVSRSGSITTEVATQDSDTIVRLRQLANYTGICHVRTVDGSNYKADVQISENYSYQSHVITSYTLDITKIDSNVLDGVPLSEWESYYESGE